MKARRSAIDWALEAIAAAAVIAAIALAVMYWDQVSDRQPRRVGFVRQTIMSAWFSPRITLWIVVLINAAAYAGLTAGAQFGKLIHIPDELDRASPHLRRALFRTVTGLKAVLMLFSLYLVWSLVNSPQSR
jgi:hypothetical protein